MRILIFAKNGGVGVDYQTSTIFYPIVSETNVYSLLSLVMLFSKIGGVYIEQNNHSTEKLCGETDKLELLDRTHSIQFQKLTYIFLLPI